MTKREFYKALNSCRNPAKTGLVRAKLESLPIATRRQMVVWLLWRRGPVLTCLLCIPLWKELWPILQAHGYWHHKGDFIYNEANWVRYPMRNEGRAFEEVEQKAVSA